MANDLLSSYLYNRKQLVTYNNISSKFRTIEYGIPQGSILGWLLFILYINDVQNALQTVPRLFADNTALIINGNNPSKILNLTNRELIDVAGWMLCNGLELNPKKLLLLQCLHICVKLLPN